MRGWHPFHFLRPWWLLALLVVAAGVLALWRAGSVLHSELSRLVDAELLPHLLQRACRQPAACRHGLFAAGWVLAAAGAGRTHLEPASPSRCMRERAAQVVAISLSQRMLARDVAPSRLDRARYKARDLLAGNRDGQNALIAFAGEAFVVAPLTTDAGSLGRTARCAGAGHHADRRQQRRRGHRAGRCS